MTRLEYLKMGIQYLNSYLKKHTSIKAINKIGLKELSGKTIVIDASIYLYRFVSEGALMENIYIMISLFKYHNIIPIFVFDGVAPPEKLELLEKRNQDKNIAEQEYNKLKQELKATHYDDNKYSEICCDMCALKKQFIRLRKSDVANVRSLITAFGLNYIDAKGEADELCAKLVIKKYAYACLSEDMDLFIYGCPRVLRYFSLINETVVIYYLDKILLDLETTFKEFKEICIISGTDYSLKKKEKAKVKAQAHTTETTINTINLYKTFDYFRQYKKENSKELNFYEWLEKNSDYITNIYQLYSIYNLFGTENINLKQIKINTKIKAINIDEVKEIMKPEGFIFI